jgi:hypothetical protein
MSDSNHISIDRMLVVATRCEKLMTDAEQAHIRQCRECLTLFGQVLMSNPDYDGGSNTE